MARNITEEDKAYNRKHAAAHNRARQRLMNEYRERFNELQDEEMWKVGIVTVRKRKEILSELLAKDNADVNE